MVYTFKRGTHPDGNKEHTKDKSIEVLKAPEYVVLPVSMHIGAPAKADFPSITSSLERTVPSSSHQLTGISIYCA